ncbi:RagB/SusD family nutrient uptake outer membrane protein [Butyricimonas faecihominis]|uniref:RagB/SusD family nutrient uptake outer membrane protein n=1 Tax=Butyricimonas faecihominis TaxID=1472416 RepID=UPI0026709E34|nr:RagB/SusD family nutrient uptake outer membrane protein [Butyricimonas faecihominis]
MANTILENAHRANMSKDRLDFWIGQASFAKGLAYFELVRLYGDAVITRNSTSLEKYGRKPMLEVMDTAIVNVERAYRLLPVFEELKDLSGAAITSKQYASKGAAVALLAHLYAWRGSVIELYGLPGDATGDYQKSIDYCTLIIDKKVGFYELQPNPEVLCLAMSKMGGENKESIFELELNPKEDYAQTVRVLGVFLTGYPVDVNATLASQRSKSFRLKWTTVEQMYETKDKRVDAYFYLDDEILNNLQTYPYAYLRKWREGIYFTSSSGSSETRMTALRANQVQWRVADIYLLRAECRAKLGIAEAKDDLNEIRTRANATLYPAAGETDLKLAIFKERERELLYENHRYSDIVRNGKAYIQKYLGLSLTTVNGLEENALKYVTDQELKDGILFQAIPESAFLMNGLMRQTPFWLKYVKY